MKASLLKPPSWHNMPTIQKTKSQLEIETKPFCPENFQAITNLTDFSNKISENCLSITFFVSSWAGNCRNFTKNLTQMTEAMKSRSISPNVCHYLNTNFLFVDVDENLELAGQENVKILPTVKFYYQGELLDVMEGSYMDEFDGKMKELFKMVRNYEKKTTVLRGGLEESQSKIHEAKPPKQNPRGKTPRQKPEAKPSKQNSEAKPPRQNPRGKTSEAKPPRPLLQLEPNTNQPFPWPKNLVQFHFSKISLFLQKNATHCAFRNQKNRTKYSTIKNISKTSLFIQKFNSFFEKFFRCFRVDKIQIWAHLKNCLAFKRLIVRLTRSQLFDFFVFLKSCRS